MSRTYHLACFETRTSVWIGQGHMPNDFYIYQDHSSLMELEEFLYKNGDKPMYLVDSEVVNDMFEMSDEKIKQILSENWPYIKLGKDE